MIGWGVGSMVYLVGRPDSTKLIICLLQSAGYVRKVWISIIVLLYGVRYSQLCIRLAPLRKWRMSDQDWDWLKSISFIIYHAKFVDRLFMINYRHQK